MKILRRLAILLFAWNLVGFCFAQQKPGVVVVNASSKELKRAAHRLRIPVEQLRNARQTLKEATDLVRKIDPYPVDQLSNLVQMWTQLDRSKSKGVIDSLVNELRSEAASASNQARYQAVTSTAISLMSRQESDTDYERMLQLIRNWPDPKFTASDALKSYRENMESQVKSQALNQLANSDPEKAMALLPKPGDPGAYPYSAAGQVARSLMNSGKKDTALQLVDQVTSGFDPNTANAQSIQNYQFFVQSIAGNLDSARASAAVGSLVTALTNPNSPNNCGMTLKTGDTSVDLTCAESRILSIVRSNPLKPGFAQKTLDAMPGLKSKLDSIGGIDALYSGASVSTTYSSGPNPTSATMIGMTNSTGGASPVNPANLYQELKGKDAATVKSRLKDSGIETLVSLAMNASSQDPDFGATVLEMAEQLIPQVEPLQRRASILRNLIQAYRQIEGESDPAMLKSGFILADQLKEEFSQKAEAAGKLGPADVVLGRLISAYGSGVTPASQLEGFLVAELSRDSYDSAMQYVRSMENDALKLQCMLQIAQALSSANY